MMTNCKAKILKTACLLFFGLGVFFTGLNLSHKSEAQSNAPTIIRDTEIEEIFREWTQPLLKSANLGEEGVNIILVQSNQINAFVAGGANIFFYTGLIQKTENPGEVIGVMAHELGHVAGGHLISNQTALERASYESILGTVLGLGAAILGGGDAATAIISGSQNLAARRYLSHSRVNESSADQAAFTYMSRAGYNPSGLASFFGKLENEELLPATQQSEYIRTHPLTRNRIEAVNALIVKSDLKDKPYPQSWTEQHARMKAKLLSFISPEQVAWRYDDQDQTIPARYARAIAAYRLNDIPTALRGIDALIASEPDNAYFHELKGQMLVDFGRLEEGLPSYQRSVELMPDAALLRMALAHVLIESAKGVNEQAQLNEALGHLERALVKEQRSTRAHRLLATAYGRLGQDNRARLHLAEEAVLQRKLPYAKAQAEAALEGFEAGSREWIQTKDLLAHIANLERLKNG